MATELADRRRIDELGSTNRVRAIDRMIAEPEMLNIQEVSKVPEPLLHQIWQALVALDAVPPKPRPQQPTRPAVLLDLLFVVQESVLAEAFIESPEDSCE